MYPESIKNLIESFKYLPGIGEKTAERLAFSVLDLEDEQIDLFSESLVHVKKIFILARYVIHLLIQMFVLFVLM